MISMWGSMWNNFKLFQGSLTRGYPQGPMYQICSDVQRYILDESVQVWLSSQINCASHDFQPDLA